MAVGWSELVDENSNRIRICFKMEEKWMKGNNRLNKKIIAEAALKSSDFCKHSTRNHIMKISK